MAVRPLNDRVVVKRLAAEETTLSGLYIPEAAQKAQEKGIVLAAGQGKILPNGTRQTPDVKIGDMVLIPKYLPETKLDGEMVVILREDDISGVFEE